MIVDQGTKLELGTMMLFLPMRLVGYAKARVNGEECVIPHKMIERVAADFIKALAIGQR